MLDCFSFLCVRVSFIFSNDNAEARSKPPPLLLLVFGCLIAQNRPWEAIWQKMTQTPKHKAKQIEMKPTILFVFLSSDLFLVCS